MGITTWKLFDNILFFSGIIITAGITFYVATRFTPKPKPIFQDFAFRIIEEKINILPKDIKILYGDKNVPRLSKYYIIFWNNGYVNLDGKTIQERDPLRLEFDKDAEIFEVKIISPLKPTIGLEFSHHDNVVNFSFNDLEPNEGFNLEVLHTGIHPKAELKGSFKNINNGIKYKGQIAAAVKRTKDFYLYYAIRGFIYALIIGIILFIISQSIFVPGDKTNIWVLIYFIPSLCIVIYIGYREINRIIDVYPSDLKINEF